MDERAGVARRGRGIAALVGLLLIASLLSPATGARAQVINCPEPFPVGDLEPGMTARGYTVERGYDAQEFDVEILGVLENGLAPGKDLIIIEATGDIIDRGGGIWAGMSGSPVYIGNKLVGAVAYGLTFGASPLGGVTPAADMLEVMNYPGASPAAAPRKATFDRSERRAFAARAGVDASTFKGGMERLLTPLAMSGVSGRALRLARETIAREDAPFIPYTAGSSLPSAAAAPTDATIEPGDSFAGALSYGDITAAGIGTATFVCDGKVAAFGHPFFFNGKTTMGANAARSLTIVSDPVFGSYKLATVENLVGTVDQDRFSAIRAVLGSGPATIPITSSVSSLDTGKSRIGETRSVLSDFVPFLTFFHMFLNIDTIFDQIGEGSSYLTWTVTGKTASGETWDLSRANRFTSRWDISFDSLWEMLEYLSILQNNNFEDIEFTGVQASVDVEEAVRLYRLVGLEWSLNGVNYKSTKRVRVRKQRTLYLRALLEDFDSAERTSVDLSLPLPRRVPRGTIVNVLGGRHGGFDLFCMFEPEECGQEGAGELDSLEDLIATLEGQPTNDMLTAQLRQGRNGAVRASVIEILDQVVEGRQRLRLRQVRR